MIRLHYHPGNASMTPHLLLCELGVPFELVLVDRDNDAHKSPAYLKLNPNGLIPVLEDGDLVLYETAAIVLHLADTHPQAALIPPLASAERAHFYKWLMWLTNTVQTTLSAYFYPDRWVDEGNDEGARQVRAHAQARVGSMLGQLDQLLASHGGPWILGAQFSAIDPFTFMVCRWTRGFKGAASAPARDFPRLGSYLQRMLERPAVQRVLAAENLSQPWV
ncbi:MAG: glutathione S-transferase family protein [Burkholderiaceae bacterium]